MDKDTFLIACDLNGCIHDIIQDDLGFSAQLTPEQEFTSSCLAPHDAQAWLEELRSKGSIGVRDWTVKQGNKTTTLYFSARIDKLRILIAAATTQESAQQIWSDFCIQPGQLIESHHYIDELGRLNNELVNLQRQLSGKNSELSGINRKLLDSIDELQQKDKVLSEALKELNRYRTETENEIGLAHHMMRQLTRSEALHDQGIGFINMPAGAFSGDVVSVARNAEDVQFVLLADITGHGLSSALNAIPLIDAFLEITESEFSLQELCQRINSRLNLILPLGYFVAAIIAAVDTKKHSIEVWNGGLPSAFLMTSTGEITKVWRSRHPALGILRNSEFDSMTELVTYEKSNQFIMFTDGLSEATSDGEAFGEKRLLSILRETKEGERLNNTQRSLSDFLKGSPPQDDISIVIISCS